MQVKWVTMTRAKAASHVRSVAKMCEGLNVDEMRVREYTDQTTGEVILRLLPVRKEAHA